MLNFRFEIEPRSAQTLGPLVSLMAQAGLIFERIEKKQLALIHLPEAQSLGQLPAGFFEHVRRVFCDANHQLLIDREYEDDPVAQTTLEIFFRPGVTDNVGKSAAEALTMKHADFAKLGVQVFTGELYSFFSATALSADELQRLEGICRGHLANPLLQKLRFFTASQWRERARFEQVDPPVVSLPACAQVKTFSLDLPPEQWARLNQENCWALSESEIEHIRQYFSQASVQRGRAQVGLTAELTDVELEVIAQSWSEHCKHKIFAAQIDYREQGPIPQAYPSFGEQKISGLYKSFIKAATRQVVEQGVDWTVSVFSDNAGIVRFDALTDVCIKVETHNSPSALDPYGGALTGILGVNRDILGVGLAARPIANTDVFCFGPPDFSGELPVGVKHPKRIFEGVHLGIEHGGNKSGIPTVNGSISFDENFCGKPLVYCGTVGVIPARDKNGRELAKKMASPGDRIVMCGGRIGKDGIHGATMSSLELSESSPVTAVQIGDPITQKRLIDFTLEARDLGLFSAITDNGAGGLSSSIGEMSTLTGGAEMDLALAPVKYPGLAPFELLVSESQERMSYAVPEKDLPRFLELAAKRNVEASVLGTFTDSGYFHVKYQSKTVLYLDLAFLHESLPAMQLKAVWTGPSADKKWGGLLAVTPQKFRDFKEGLLSLLARPNVASKEKWVRRYDHEVGAATIGKPFCGKKGLGPADAGVVWMYPHGGEKQRALAISHGLAPRWSFEDPYFMAQAAVDEAVRNAVCVGADPKKIALVDNFCWPDPLPGKNNPDHSYKLAQLVRACRGLYDICLAYGLPLVSGKDSMKNDLVGKMPDGRPVKISVPPTLLITALADVPEVGHLIDMSFKRADQLIYLLGAEGLSSLAASQWAEMTGVQTGTLPAFNLKDNLGLYQRLFAAIEKDLVESAHDISDGGVAVALCESALAGELGAKLHKAQISAEFLFNEKPGQILVTVAPENQKAFEAQMKGVALELLGHTQRERRVDFGSFHLSLEEIALAWRSLC